MTNDKTIKDKLKCIYNCKALWITAFCLVQIAFISANIFYYSRTNYCCDIYITSPTDCEVAFVTPIGTKYTQNVKANVTFHEYKRPLAEVRAPECATLRFSSDKINAVDVFVFTLIRLCVLWLVLTILCTLPLPLYKKKWLIFILQIPFVAIFIFIYFTTNYYCGLTIFSPQECAVQITSPLGSTTNINVPANEDIYIKPDAIKVIYYPEYVSVQFDSISASLADIFIYYCRQGFFFYWFTCNLCFILSFLIHLWQPTNKIQDERH